MMARVTNALLVAGSLAIFASGLWWWLTYGEVIQYDYIGPREASLCLFGDSEICKLARSLCRGAHPATLAAYRASLLWLGLLALSASVTLPHAPSSPSRRKTSL
jgi:hypothetical protein